MVVAAVMNSWQLAPLVLAMTGLAEEQIPRDGWGWCSRWGRISERSWGMTATLNVWVFHKVHVRFSYGLKDSICSYHIYHIYHILLMEEILHQWIGRLCHYSHGFRHLNWCRISSINSITPFSRRIAKVEKKGLTLMASSLAMLLSRKPSDLVELVELDRFKASKRPKS